MGSVYTGKSDESKPKSEIEHEKIEWNERWIEKKSNTHTSTTHRPPRSH